MHSFKRIPFAVIIIIFSYYYKINVKPSWLYFSLMIIFVIIERMDISTNYKHNFLKYFQLIFVILIPYFLYFIINIITKREILNILIDVNLSIFFILLLLGMFIASIQYVIIKSKNKSTLITILLVIESLYKWPMYFSGGIYDGIHSVFDLNEPEDIIVILKAFIKYLFITIVSGVILFIFTNICFISHMNFIFEIDNITYFNFLKFYFNFSIIIWFFSAYFSHYELKYGKFDMFVKALILGSSINILFRLTLYQIMKLT